MKREIKFRAWDGKKMREVARIDFNNNLFDLMLKTPTESAPDHWCLRKLSDTPLMQFTGLHDKNGKEIYEGDVVRGHRAACKYLKQKDWLGIIEYSKVRCGFVVRVKHLDGIDTFDNIVSCDSDYQVDVKTLTDYQYEIIGNIYQNPELCTP